jgi:hypothetical protein
MEDEVRVWYDEASGVVFNQDAATTVEAARKSLGRATELMEGKPRRLLLIDLSDAKLNMSSEARRGIMDEARAIRVDRQAFVVRNPVIRMLAKAIARVTVDVNKSAFFGTPEDAVVWLRKED